MKFYKLLLGSTNTTCSVTCKQRWPTKEKFTLVLRLVWDEIPMETLKLNVFNFLNKSKTTTVPLVALWPTFPSLQREGSAAKSNVSSKRCFLFCKCWENWNCHHFMGGGTFFKVGGTSSSKKTIEKFCGLNWQLWRYKHWNMASSPVHHMKV